MDTLLEEKCRRIAELETELAVRMQDSDVRRLERRLAELKNSIS